MLVLGLDFEADGIKPEVARPTEIGAVLWDTEDKRPLKMIQEYFYATNYPILTPENVAITGIQSGDLVAFGVHPGDYFLKLQEMCKLWDVKYIVAHNGTGYDQILLKSECNMWHPPDMYKDLLSIPWVDTKLDLPFMKEPESRKLKHLALDAGFINLLGHRALCDVLTMMKLVSQFDFEDILAYRAIPWMVVKAEVSFNDKQLAKDAKFSWERIDYDVYPKSWVRRIKTTQLDGLKATCKFPLTIIEGVK